MDLHNFDGLVKEDVTPEYSASMYDQQKNNNNNNSNNDNDNNNNNNNKNLEGGEDQDDQDTAPLIGTLSQTPS